MRLNTIQFPTA